MKSGVPKLLLLCSSVTAFQTTRPHGKIISTGTARNGPILKKENRAATTSRLPAVNPLISTFQAVESPIGSLAVLAGVVIVHECGHFLAARNFGVKINEFSVGFGPKLFGFKALKSKKEGDDGVQFSVRALPLGGYVAFPENYNRTLAFQLETERQRKIEEYEAENGKSGFFSSIFVNKKKQEEDRIAKLEAENKANSRKWWQFNKKTAKAKEPFDPKKPIDIEYYDDPDYLQNRPWFERAVVLSGGVIFNLLLAFSLYFGSATIGPGVPKPIFEPGAVVAAKPKQAGASFGVLNQGDVIVGVNGYKLPVSSAATAGASQKAISDIISEIRKTPPGDDVKLMVKQKNSPSPVDLSIVPRPMDGESGPQSIGVTLSSNFIRTEMAHASNVGEAAVIAGSTVQELATDTAKGFASLIEGYLKGNNNAGRGMSGPVGIIKMGSDVVSSSDVNAIVAFAAAISINLAVVNALPFPALDGGQLLFVISEAFTGKKIDQRVQEEINATALLLLLLVSAGSVFGDVGKLLQ